MGERVGADDGQELGGLLLRECVHRLSFYSWRTNLLHRVLLDELHPLGIFEKQFQRSVVVADGFRGERFAETAFILCPQIEQIAVNLHCRYLLEGLPFEMVCDDFQAALIIADGFCLSVRVEHLKRKPIVIAEPNEIGFRFFWSGSGDAGRSGSGRLSQTPFPNLGFHFRLFAGLCGTHSDGRMPSVIRSDLLPAPVPSKRGCEVVRNRSVFFSFFDVGHKKSPFCGGFNTQKGDIKEGLCGNCAEKVRNFWGKKSP